MDDIIGSFHGMNQPAQLLVAIRTTMKRYIPSEDEYEVLMKWLEGNRISEDYDSLELGDFAPAEILSRNCVRCHSPGSMEGGGIGDRISLEYWEDVKEIAFSKNLDPVPLDILVTSTHTHALTQPMIAVVSSLLFFFTAWPRRVKHTLVMLVFAALFLDLASWWLSREWQVFCYVLVVAGGCFGGIVGLQLICAFLETWFGGLLPKSQEKEIPSP
jgi:hypothetical protein